MEYQTEKAAGKDTDLGELLNSKVEKDKIFESVIDDGENYIVEKNGYEVTVSKDGERITDSEKAGGVRPNLDVISQYNDSEDEFIITVTIKNIEELDTVDNIKLLNEIGEEIATTSSLNGNSITFNVKENGIYKVIVEATTDGITKIGNKNIKIESFIGYYADIDDNGTVDGIIFADLSIGGSSKWGDGRGDNEYSVPIITDLKEYYISQKDYSGDFGTKDVISVKDKNSQKNDRFYVMDLSDIDENRYYWYKSAFGKMTMDTSTKFGSGKENTRIMISQWNSNKYSPQDNNDIWRLMQTKIDNGWFLPSKEEWSAFAEKFDLVKNYEKYKMKSSYWSSSQHSENTAWFVDLYNGAMSANYVSGTTNVRLIATF